MTPVADDDALAEALQITRALRRVQDLAAPLTEHLDGLSFALVFCTCLSPETFVHPPNARREYIATYTHLTYILHVYIQTAYKERTWRTTSPNKPKTT